MALTEKVVIQAFNLKCRGATINREPVLPEGKEEQILVVVHNIGENKVYCRYREANAGCSICDKPDRRDNGICHYVVPTQ
jgi:hypothetical protein